VVELCLDREQPSFYRLDLRLGIPQSRIPGPLESWIGDPGLTQHPDHHPYIVVGNVVMNDGGSQHGMMQVISRSVDESGPIQVEVNGVPGVSSADIWYKVEPSPGLRSFIVVLCRSCPVVATPGSLVDTSEDGKTGPFVITPAFSKMKNPFGKGRVLKNVDSLKAPDEEGNRGMRKRNRMWPEMDDGPVKMDILRIVLRKGGLAVAEYDLARKKWLRNTESIQGKNAKASLRRFRIDKGLQMIGPNLSLEPEIQIISDLHLGHANSIPRYKRPFFSGNIREMDRVIIRNWNWTVKENDTVIFLGDLSFMSQERPESYLQRLKGSIFFLEGNHDPYYPNMSRCLLMRYQEVPYLFIHDPEELARPFEGWVIHGHVHNKDLARYPFFNPFDRTVNVSAEMIGYRPISFKEIHSLVLGTKEIVRFRKLPTDCSCEQDPSMSPDGNRNRVVCYDSTDRSPDHDVLDTLFTHETS
jgi:calcineurin-like phosphoesterase family protein